ncbi:MAG TPA: HDOD domain-containing protein [Bryobacteraceae bacterium]|nr:HDOD domain-containing protein [Bryobacteraceae bacterium]
MTVANGIDAILDRLNELPPLSPTLAQLMETLSRSDVCFADVSGVVEKDPVLAGRVLELVNSAAYQRSDPVTSVSRAAALLGLERIRNMGLGLSLVRLWERIALPPGFSVTRFNLHSAAVGVLSDLLAKELDVENREGAFVAGLLHDLGELLMAAFLPEEYGKIRDIIQQSALPTIEADLQILGAHRYMLTTRALERWRMPVFVQSAIAALGEPDEDSDAGPRITLTRVLRISDASAQELGYSTYKDPVPHEVRSQDSIASLGLRKPEKLLGTFTGRIETVSVFLRCRPEMPA